MLYRAFCVGSKDMTTRVYGTEPYNNLIVNSIGGHNGAIVGAFFEKDSLNVSFTYFTSWYLWTLSFLRIAHFAMVEPPKD